MKKIIILIIIFLLFYIIFNFIEKKDNKKIVQDGEQSDVLKDLSEEKYKILSGGIPKDGIPSIDNPEFVNIKYIPSWLDIEQEGLIVSKNGIDKFYSFQILASHEIVNDMFGEDLVSVTFCPLCYTAVAFEGDIDGVKTEFGVSGKLWNSNLLMYNRNGSENLWSQISGESVEGDKRGGKLKYIFSNIINLKSFVSEFPQGKVLIGEKNNLKKYTHTPYGGDLKKPNIRFPVSKESNIIPKYSFVYGVNVDEEFFAFEKKYIKIKKEEIFFTKKRKKIEIIFNDKLGTALFFEVLSDDEKKQINSIPGFWFSWFATHPETKLFYNK